jgi:hypothetical protein
MKLCGTLMHAPLAANPLNILNIYLRHVAGLEMCLKIEYKFLNVFIIVIKHVRKLAVDNQTLEKWNTSNQCCKHVSAIKHFSRNASSNMLATTCFSANTFLID